MLSAVDVSEMPNDATTGNKFLVYGDFRRYYIVERVEQRRPSPLSGGAARVSRGVDRRVTAGVGRAVQPRR
jgi:hypothetical protein